MSNPVKNWLKRRAEERKEFLFREKLHPPFKGKLFKMCARTWPAGENQLKKFDPEQGLGESLHSVAAEDMPYPVYQIYNKAIPDNEMLLATGKVIVKKIILAQKAHDLIFAIEVLTSQGVGYLPRDRLVGPLVMDKDTVRLETDKQP